MEIHRITPIPSGPNKFNNIKSSKNDLSDAINKAINIAVKYNRDEDNQLHEVINYLNMALRELDK